MNAHDIIANEGGQLTAEDRPNSYDEIRASFVLTALWEAAGATDTDTITIAADGTVGRLETDPMVSRLSTKLLVSEQDVELWAAYAQSLEGIVRKLRTLEPGPRGREVAYTADEMDTLRQVPS